MASKKKPAKKYLKSSNKMPDKEASANKASVKSDQNSKVSTLFPVDLFNLHSSGILTTDEVRSKLGYPPLTVPNITVDIRSLADGSVENLYSDGKRLIVPYDTLRVTSFDQLPAPWNNIEFSVDRTNEPVESDESAVVGLGTLDLSHTGDVVETTVKENAEHPQE